MNKWKPTKPCIQCPKFERIAENAGVCHEYGFQIFIELAKKQIVCQGMQNEVKS